MLSDKYYVAWDTANIMKAGLEKYKDNYNSKMVMQITNGLDKGINMSKFLEKNSELEDVYTEEHAKLYIEAVEEENQELADMIVSTFDDYGVKRPSFSMNYIKEILKMKEEDCDYGRLLSTDIDGKPTFTLWQAETIHKLEREGYKEDVIELITKTDDYNRSLFNENETYTLYVAAEAGLNLKEITRLDVDGKLVHNDLHEYVLDTIEKRNKVREEYKEGFFYDEMSDLYPYYQPLRFADENTRDIAVNYLLDEGIDILENINIQNGGTKHDRRLPDAITPYKVSEIIQGYYDGVDVSKYTQLDDHNEFVHSSKSMKILREMQTDNHYDVSELCTSTTNGMASFTASDLRAFKFALDNKIDISNLIGKDENGVPNLNTEQISRAIIEEYADIKVQNSQNTL